MWGPRLELAHPPPRCSTCFCLGSSQCALAACSAAQQAQHRTLEPLQHGRGHEANEAQVVEAGEQIEGIDGHAGGEDDPAVCPGREGAGACLPAAEAPQAGRPPLCLSCRRPARRCLQAAAQPACPACVTRFCDTTRLPSTQPCCSQRCTATTAPTAYKVPLPSAHLVMAVTPSHQTFSLVPGETCRGRSRIKVLDQVHHGQSAPLPRSCHALRCRQGADGAPQSS